LVALPERFGLQPGTEVQFVAGKDTLQVKPRLLSQSQTDRASIGERPSRDALVQHR
jgi:hypothetical protein